MIPKTESLDDFLRNCAAAVDAEMSNLIPSQDIEPVRLHAAMRWSVFAGGKRFRPALLIAVGKTFGADETSLLRTAVAIEMIHTYSLIHDDLPAMDNDNLRRGRATCHIKFDEATAILAGDTLQNLAYLTIASDEKLSAQIRVRLISEIAAASGSPNGMVAGQQMDLEAEGDSENISIEMLERIHRYKTGAMITVSARAGAIIAGTSESELASITKFAERIGLLFQITDDILDVTQTTEILGKTAGKDVSADKATYPAFFGLDETRRRAKEIFEASDIELKNLNRDTHLLSSIAEFIYSRKS